MSSWWDLGAGGGYDGSKLALHQKRPSLTSIVPIPGMLTSRRF
jgi:hypothetical protein